MSKVKLVKKTLRDSNLAEMFNQMLGGEGDPEIVAAKLKNVRHMVKMAALSAREFGNGPISKKFPEYQEWCNDFVKFAERTEALAELDYHAFKEANQTKHLVLVCSELVVYSHFLEGGVCDENGHLRDRWINTHPGLVFEIFAFTKLDIKHIWANENITTQDKKFILTIISLLFNKCREIHRVITSPDVDVKKFSRVIIESIEKVQSMPQLNRCRDAFNKIRDSVALLETNFGDYYKDMVQSENPNTLIENFIVDVSKGQDMNLSLMRQFREIINFYKKQSAGKIKDPKVKKLFDSLNSRMDMLEKKAQTTDESSSDEE